MQIIANNLKNQVKVFDNTPVLSIEIISKILNEDISELINIITTKKKKFKKLGFLRLVKSNPKICLLNERQIYLLFTYLKQSETLQELNQSIISIFVSFKKENENISNYERYKEYFKIANIIIKDKNIESIYNESM
jgi:hypothetical protein